MKKKTFFPLLFLLLFYTTSFAYIYQGNWRFYQDDATESAATAIAAENTSITVAPGQVIRLRVELYNDDGDDYWNDNFDLRYSTSNDPSSGTWNTLSSSEAFDFYDSSFLTNNATVSANLLTTTSGFTHATGGIVKEDNPKFIQSFLIAESFENVFSIQATSNAVDATTYYFAVHMANDPLMGGYATIPSVTYDASLPVSLASFTAQQKKNTVLLNWRTASEVDHQGFIVERKVNGSSWMQITSYVTNTDLLARGDVSSGADYEFTDTDVRSGDKLSYRLLDVDVNGVTTINKPVSITIEDSVVPEKTALLPAYPNPFNPDTRFQYQLKDETHVDLYIADLLGRTVRTLVSNSRQEAGLYNLQWNGVDDLGTPQSSGIYLIVLQAGNQTQIQKITLLK